ncbi:hypothetical protein BpHYR1_045654 [Brachionus plicatilis]|uniref:Uncharacterized protein n=1 Tax=Brachionus plicatilis TaxID=10195 RepID=A0A3M7PEJ1_BRAPC|nr:hypothetical protein BpHYR1_045654 [Brachionus plicatilis]
MFTFACVLFLNWNPLVLKCESLDLTIEISLHEINALHSITGAQGFLKCNCTVVLMFNSIIFYTKCCLIRLKILVNFKIFLNKILTSIKKILYLSNKLSSN